MSGRNPSKSHHESPSCHLSSLWDHEINFIENTMHHFTDRTDDPRQLKKKISGATARAPLARRLPPTARKSYHQKTLSFDTITTFNSVETTTMSEYSTTDSVRGNQSCPSITTDNSNDPETNSGAPVARYLSSSAPPAISRKKANRYAPQQEVDRLQPIQKSTKTHQKEKETQLPPKAATRVGWNLFGTVESDAERTAEDHDRAVAPGMNSLNVVSTSGMNLIETVLEASEICGSVRTQSPPVVNEQAFRRQSADIIQRKPVSDDDGQWTESSSQYHCDSQDSHSTQSSVVEGMGRKACLADTDSEGTSQVCESSAVSSGSSDSISTDLMQDFMAIIRRDSSENEDERLGFSDSLANSVSRSGEQGHCDIETD